ncbi:MAG TPA: hypothetical protein VM431_15740 [Phycisphaerae bacterium]|nr:hypothetical protein [Phycisphaerae bacterium]
MPLAEDVHAAEDLPVAEPVAPEPVVMAHPVPVAREIPVAEEVPPRPKPPRPAAKPTPAAPPEKRAPARLAAVPQDDAAAELDETPPDPPPPQADDPPSGGDRRPPRRRRRGRLVALLVVALLVLAVVLAPTILSMGFARQYVLDMANERLPVRVDAQGWALSWFGAQQVSGMSVQMPEGQRVATVRDVVLEQGLFELLSDPTRIGCVRLAGVEAWADGLKQAAAAFAAEQAVEAPAPPKPPPTKPPPTKPPPVKPGPEAEVPEAPAPPMPAPGLTLPQEVEIRDATFHGGPAELRVAQAVLKTGADNDTVHADLRIIHGQAAGTATLDAKLTGLSSDWQGPEALGAEGTLACADLPVKALWAIATDLGLAMQGDGTLSLRATFSHGRSGDVAVQATCQGANLVATGEPIQGDRVTLESLDLTVDAAYARGVVTVAKFNVTTPPLTAAAAGTFGLAAFETAPPAGEGSAKVTLDAGRIARMLPSTLRLHKDLTVEAGILEVTLKAASDEKASRIQVTVDLKDLRGTRDGKPLVLAPVQLVADLARPHPAAGVKTAAAKQTDWLARAKGITVNAVKLTGPFGTVDAAGTLEAFRLTAQLDLAKATEETGRFLDLEGYGAAGNATITLSTKGKLPTDLGATLRVDLTDLVVLLGGGSQLREARATLSAETEIKVDAQDRLTDVTVKTFTLDAATASLTATGFAQRIRQSWQFQGTAGGKGTVANLGGLVAIALPLATGAKAPDAKADAAPDWRQMVLDYARGASGAGGKPAEGTWQLSVEAGGAVDQAMAVKSTMTVAGLVMPLARPEGKTLRLATATLTSDVLYAPGERAKVTVHLIQAAIPGASATVQGPATIEVAGAASVLSGTLQAVVKADLPTLTQTLAPFDLLPKEPTLVGEVDVQVTASPGIDHRTVAKVVVTGHKFEMAWADGRGYSDPLPRVTADAALIRNDAGDLTEISVTNWSVATVAGSLAGTASATRSEDRWHWQATAAGDGAIRPVAMTVAKLRAQPASPIRGLWKIDAGFDSRAQRLTLTASATNLAIPQEGEPAKPDLRLDDVRLQTNLVLADDDVIRIEQANLSGPGIAARASGTARMPSKPDDHPSADGSVTVKANLAECAQVLKPFGLLPDDARLAGTADLDLKVAGTVDGFTGQGALDLTDLDIQTTASRMVVQEKKAHLPITLTYEKGKRRWEFLSQNMKAETVSGTWRAAVTETDTAPLIQARCDLVFDAKRVRDLLGSALPPTIRMSGPWRLAAGVAGALKSEKPAPPPAAGAPDAKPMPWHRRIAGLASDGSLEVKRFEYETLSGGDGTVTWKMADGRITLAPDPQKPSTLALAGGKVNLGGVIDLSGDVPRLVIAKRLVMAEGVPLGGEEVQGYLKYMSPVLAASMSARGNLSLAIEHLDVPLTEGAAGKAVATGEYWIDDFQTELIGLLGKLVQVTRQSAKTITQPFGPIRVQLRDGLITIPEHDLRYSETVSLRFGGTIGVDKQMNVMVGIPLTDGMLARYKVSAAALPYLKGAVIALPLKGTIDNPRLDESAIAKRLGEMALDAIKRQTLERLGDWLKGSLKKP